MVKFASSVVLAALIAAPALAAYTGGSYESRELTDAESDFYARELEDLYTRLPEQSDVDARELQTLETRNFKSFMGGLFHKVTHLLFRRQDGEEVVAREYDEVDARELDEFYERLFSELDERNYPHAALEGVKAIVHNHHHEHHSETEGVPSTPREFFDEDELLERDLEEFMEREYEDDYDLLVREFEEFDDLD